MLSKRVPDPSSILEQNTDSFINSTAATSSAFIADYAASPNSPTLKLTRKFENMTTDKDVDLPISELLPQFTSGNAVSLKYPFL